MVEKGIRGGVSHTIHQYVKANVKLMKNYNKVRELSYLKYWDVNDFYGCATLQKLPVGGFK